MDVSPKRFYLHHPKDISFNQPVIVKIKKYRLSGNNLAKNAF